MNYDPLYSLHWSVSGLPAGYDAWRTRCDDGWDEPEEPGDPEIYEEELFAEPVLTGSADPIEEREQPQQYDPEDDYGPRFDEGSEDWDSYWGDDEGE